MNEHLPMRPVELQILIALLGRPLHGYGLVKAVREESRGVIELEPGNLYRRLHRLLSSGLVREAASDAVDPVEDDARDRRYYTITTTGRKVVAAELQRLRTQVDVARAYGLKGLEG